MSTIVQRTSSPTSVVSGRLSQEVAARLLSEVTRAEGLFEELTTRAPYTGEVLTRIPSCGERDVQLAVARARAAQPGWAARGFGERARILLRFHDLVLQRQDEVLDLIQLENGKARRHAFEEILDTAVVARYYALRARKYLKTRRRRGALPILTKASEVRVPVGVVGLISPWNFPFNLPVSDAVAALAAGNSVVLKPDPHTSLTALWAVALLREAGLPRDVLQAITGEGPRIGPALSERVDFLMFTGSTRTGKIVARAAADRLIGCSLELGGKNPMLVLRDADLDKAAEGAVRGSFTGAGQVCVSIERIYVHESVYEPFLNRFAELTRALRAGVAFDYSMDLGSVTTEAQLATIEDHVRDAIEKGANLLTGGRRRPDLGPLFYEPTILTGVTETMRLYAEETFGPVVAVYPFRTEDEAIERANDTRYGLSASVWTRDTARGEKVARRIHSGSVNVNDAYAATWGSVDSPIGGLKESGLRPRHGAEGILKFTESQTIAVQRLLPIGPPPGMDPAVHARWMTRLLKLLRRIRILG